MNINKKDEIFKEMILHNEKCKGLYKVDKETIMIYITNCKQILIYNNNTNVLYNIPRNTFLSLKPNAKEMTDFNHSKNCYGRITKHRHIRQCNNIEDLIYWNKYADENNKYSNKTLSNFKNKEILSCKS